MLDLQQRIQAAIDGLVASGAERGVQVAVYRRGEQVVDAVAGVADADTGRSVTPDTPFYCYSMGKGATATVVHVLVERGLFDYDTPIVELWPEFGAHGKEAATVRHALTHTVGVPALPPDTTPEDVCDWEKMCSVIADMEPWWEPGTRTAYHAYTFGYILGEVVRRATGERISRVLREEVAEPLGAGDELYFGMPGSGLDRVARLEDAPGSAEFLASLPDDSPFLRWAPRTVFPTAEFGNRHDVLLADIPAGGKMSARAMARMYAGLLGEVDGEQGDGRPLHGKHVRMERLLNVPQILSRPHPPILIAGSGEKRTLPLVARYADACNLRPSPEIPRQLELLRRLCEQEARDYDVIEKTAPFGFDVGPDGSKVGEVMDQLRWLAGMGIETVFGWVVGVDRITPLEIMEREVIPAAAELRADGRSA